MVFDKEDYFEEVFEGLKIDGFDDIRFDECVFKNCDISSGVFHRVKFYECRFIECDISLAKFHETSFNEVEFVECKASGVNWELAYEHFDISMRGCNLSMSIFHKCDLRGCSFSDCRLEDVDFEEANLQSASFDGSDLSNAIFNQTNLKETDLSGAINYLINPSENYLKKTKVSTAEALSFLKFIDIDIVK